MKDIYLKFTQKTNSMDIPGESLDDAHKDGKWMEIATWHHAIRQPKSATSSTAGGHTSERCEHEEMLFTKNIDKSSPYIWEACSAGYAYDVEIQFFRAQGSKRTEYLTSNCPTPSFRASARAFLRKACRTKRLASSTPRSSGTTRVPQPTARTTSVTIPLVGIWLSTRRQLPDRLSVKGRFMRPFFVSCAFKHHFGIDLFRPIHLVRIRLLAWTLLS